jgi:carbonic anhydrase
MKCWPPNAKCAENFGDKGNLPLPPSRHFGILTCMDARLDPAKYAGLAEGDVHVIRNAGGRASDDALRSLLATGLDLQKATISTG